MTDLKILFDYRAKPLYLAYGRYRPLVCHVNFKTRTGRLLDKAALAVQSVLHISKKADNRHLMVWNDMRNRVNYTIDAMILYDTSWYKECQYIGFLKTESKTHFIRYFRQPEDIVFFHHQNQLIQQYFHGIFSTVPVTLSDGNVLLQPVVSRKRSVQKNDHIEDKIVYYTQKTLKSETIRKDIRDIVPIDFFFLCSFEKKGSDLPVKVRVWLDSIQDPVPLIPVHGDLTPWNIIINQQEQAVLIDYERAGWHVPYYDLFHYTLQEQALAANTSCLDYYLKKWADDFGPDTRTYLILYLIDQIHYDLNSKKQFEHHNAHLNRMIDTKITWLQKLIGDQPKA